MLTIGNIAMFVVKSIVIQINGQVIDISMDSSTTVNHDHFKNSTWSILIQRIRDILSGDNLI